MAAGARSWRNATGSERGCRFPGPAGPILLRTGQRVAKSPFRRSNPTTVGSGPHRTRSNPSSRPRQVVPGRRVHRAVPYGEVVGDLAAVSGLLLPPYFILARTLSMPSRRPRMPGSWRRSLSLSGVGVHAGGVGGLEVAELCGQDRRLLRRVVDDLGAAEQLDGGVVRRRARRTTDRCPGRRSRPPRRRCSHRSARAPRAGSCESAFQTGLGLARWSRTVASPSYRKWVGTTTG